MRELNLDAVVEVGFKGLSSEKRREYFRIFKTKPMVVGPRIRNLHTWFARRPCSTSCALTIGATMPEDMEADFFSDALGLENISSVAKNYGSALLFYARPNRQLIEKR